MKILFAFAFSLYSYTSYCQNQELQLAGYNIGLAGLGAGIGSIINKPRSENWRRAFVRGFWQGSIGGTLNYSAKKSIYLISKNRNTAYAWPSHLLYAAGSSIVENAALHEPFLKNWHIDLWYTRIDFSKKNKFKIRLLPEAIYATLWLNQYGDFNWRETLKTGTITFSNKNLLNLPYPNTSAGANLGRAIIFVDNFPFNLDKYQLIAHELVHTFQYKDYIFINNWLKPAEKKINNKFINTLFSKFIYFDMPYYFFFSALEKSYEYPHYYKNHFEFEAQRFSTGRFVNR